LPAIFSKSERLWAFGIFKSEILPRDATTIPELLAQAFAIRSVKMRAVLFLIPRGKSSVYSSS